MKPLFFLCMLLVFASCKTISVIAPTPSTIVAPPIKQGVSSLNIPIEIEMKSYLKMTEEALPKKFIDSIYQCEGVSLSYIFIREPIDFKFKNSNIEYEVDGKFGLKLNYCPKCHELLDKNGTCIIPRIYASCGSGSEAMRRVKVAYTTSISLSENYKFEATTTLKKFDILDPCKITLFKYDVTPEVEKEVTGQLIALEDDIDKQIEALDVKSSLKDVWLELQKGLPVSTYGFLYMQPKSIGMSELKFTNNKVFLDLHLAVYPFVSTEEQKEKITALPALGKFVGKTGFNLSLDIRASYDSLSAFVGKEFVGQEFNFKRKKIFITGIKISGAQDQKLIFKMDFDGVKKGAVYLTGIPTLDTITQKISMKELDFDIQTKSVLLKTAKWLFNKKILEELEKNSVFELEDLLNESKLNIASAINEEITKGVKMSGAVNQISLQEIYLDKENMLLRSEVTGTLKIKID
jgi:hypothetical protein